MQFSILHCMDGLLSVAVLLINVKEGRKEKDKSKVRKLRAYESSILEDKKLKYDILT